MSTAGDTRIATNSTAIADAVELIDPSPKFIAALIEATGRPFEDLFVIVSDQ